VPPSGRHGHAAALVGSVAYYYGGEDGAFAEAAVRARALDRATSRRALATSARCSLPRCSPNFAPGPHPRTCSTPAQAIVMLMRVLRSSPRLCGGQEGFVNDLWALHLDAMTDFYPSDAARDLAWQARKHIHHPCARIACRPTRGVVPARVQQLPPPLT
jgi:hypothetical protein